jgi:hypothetical protein
MGLMATCDEIATLITPELNNLQAKSQQVSVQQLPGTILRRHAIPNAHSPPVHQAGHRRQGVPTFPGLFSNSYAE